MSLSQDQIDIIHATVPVLEQQGEEITRCFYNRMLEENPAVNDFFNKTHQETLAQPRALAHSLVAYAKNIDNLDALGGLVERVAQKHCSLLVQPEHYPIVGKYLLMAIEQVLGQSVATKQVLDAWASAYQILANILIESEALIYDNSEKAEGGWRGYRPFKVDKIVPESDSVTSFYLSPVDGGKVVDAYPGQYLGFQVKIGDGQTVYLRQYSISSMVEANQYRVSIKKVPGGIVSKYWHTLVKLGTTINVTPPCGELVLDDKDKDSNLILLGAGIGVTPLVPIAQRALARGQKVTFVQADKAPEQRPFGQYLDKVAEKYPQFTYDTVYSDTQGRLTGDELRSIIDRCGPGPITIYMVGPKGFMKDMKTAIEGFGRSDLTLKFEVFGPSIE